MGRLRQTQNAIRGDPLEITSTRPGVAFERLSRAKGNSRGERCYTLGTSFQDSTQLAAPSERMKAGIGPVDYIHDIMKVHSTQRQKLVPNSFV